MQNSSKDSVNGLCYFHQSYSVDINDVLFLLEKSAGLIVDF